jgi:hypothetical protein
MTRTVPLLTVSETTNHRKWDSLSLTTIFSRLLYKGVSIRQFSLGSITYSSLASDGVRNINTSLEKDRISINVSSRYTKEDALLRRGVIR